MSVQERQQAALSSTPGPRRSWSPQQINEAGLAAGVVVLIVVLTVSAPGFASLQNGWSILRDAATVGIVAWGATLVIVAGEIDISIGPAVAFWSVVLAETTTAWHLPLGLAILVTLAGGALVGAGAGWLRSALGVPSFIVTLGLWSALRGLAQFITDAIPVPMKDSGTLDVLSGSVLGVPTPVLVMFVLFVLFAFIARRTTYGRSVFAVGGNARAAALSGIPVPRVRVLIFATTGLLSALVGILLAARLGSGNGGAATGLEFDVVAAVVVGGTSLSGGRGSMLGSLLGVLFIAIIGNGLVLLGVNPFFQDVVRGVVIVLAVLVNLVLSRRGRLASD